MTTIDTSHQHEVAQQGAEDAGRYFRYMADFVGFSAADAEAIRQTKPVLQKHLAEIVSKFYAHVLRYPPTRKFFLKQDGSIDQPYLELRMRHLTNFWLRTADGVFDDEYARYVDYVGRAHTAHGADPNIYIAERYVIGQVGMMQHAISDVLSRELRAGDDEVEFRAVEAWDKLMMVVLELLARAYGREHEAEAYAALAPVDQGWVAGVAAGAVAREQGSPQALPTKDLVVASVDAIPDGDRKIVEVDGLSIGVFHHKGAWYALRNSCIHRGGPVATGRVDGDILVCPWHGFQFDIASGRSIADPSARLDSYPVTIQDGQVHLHVPLASGAAQVSPQPIGEGSLREDEFRIADLKAGHIRQVKVGGTEVAVYNVGGVFYATQDACTHAGGLLSESDLEGKVVTCYLHGSCFDVDTGAVRCGPATEPLKRYQVTVNGDVGRVTPA